MTDTRISNLKVVGIDIGKDGFTLLALMMVANLFCVIRSNGWLWSKHLKSIQSASLA